MAVMLIFHAPDMNQGHYDSLRPAVNWEGEPPAGLLLHSCAFDEQGGCRVVDIWDNEGALHEFFGTRLMPAFQQLGLPEPPPPVILQAHNVDAYPGIAAHTP
jgi:hypothetical protein